MGLKILFGLLLSISLYAEPSVYSRATTYKSSSNSSNAIYRLQQQVATLKEEVEGLKSLVESLSTQISRINSIKTSSRDDNSKKNDAKINMLLSRVEKLEDVVRDINKRMVTSITNATPLPKKEHSKRVASSSTINIKTSNYKLYKKGVILFDRKRYSDAKYIFETLLKRGYKKAATNFYLGEIAYRTGRYRDAIKYYQESAELDDDAAYMDRLLLHTGISLEKDGDKQQAKRFYEAIIDGYPNTSSARIAKKRLK